MRFQIELATKYGYAAETHKVTTKDGYILTVHRFTGTKASPSPANKPAVLLQHGIVDTSASWVLGGPHQGLAYKLVDEGYDVWACNSRGNRYSREHVTLNADTDETYWDFTFHQLGIFDLPATIDYIEAETGQAKIQYVGHSQGTTILLVLMSERPEYNLKVHSANLMAPVAFCTHMPGVVFRSGSVIMGYEAVSVVVSVVVAMSNTLIYSIFLGGAWKQWLL